MRIIENALSDRGSKYAVSGGQVADASAAKAFVKKLCRKKKFAKATHNTWAVILPDGTPIKNDDGESGAGMVILRMLERENRIGEIVIVTRWSVARNWAAIVFVVCRTACGSGSIPSPQSGHSSLPDLALAIIGS